MAGKALAYPPKAKFVHTNLAFVFLNVYICGKCIAECIKSIFG